MWNERSELHGPNEGCSAYRDIFGRILNSEWNTHTRILNLKTNKQLIRKSLKFQDIKCIVWALLCSLC